jgi:hypothetical protein
MQNIMELDSRTNLLRSSKALPQMLSAKSVPAPEKGPLSYLVNTPAALRLLWTYKIKDARCQHLLLQFTFLLLAFLGCGICGFFIVPTFWAVGAFAPGIMAFGLLISIGAGDLFLKYALEDKGFFQMATQRHALSVFVDEDQSLPQPETNA